MIFFSQKLFLQNGWDFLPKYILITFLLTFVYFYYSIKVLQRVDTAKKELSKLKETWTWKETSLKMAGIGKPNVLILNIMSKGSYEPFVPLGSIRRNKVKDFAELLADINDDISLFDEEYQPVLELAGSVQINNANQVSLDRAISKLQEIAAELVLFWDRRQTNTLLQNATMKAFGQIHENNEESIVQRIDLLNKVIVTLLHSDFFMFSHAMLVI